MRMLFSTPPNASAMFGKKWSRRDRSASFYCTLLVELAAFFLVHPALAQNTVLTFEKPDLAGISGFRALWDIPIPLSEDGVTQIVDPVVKDKNPTAIWSPDQRHGTPGAIAFDALNRSLLVRFPGSIETILNQLRQGYAITKLELVLPFRDTELWPPGDTNFAPSNGYLYRTNWGVDELYRKLAPQWHAVAWALRRPWQSDARIGPTFNAYINGTGFWSKFGAGDEQHDRFPLAFGPVELSQKATEGRLDITSMLNDPLFGDTLAIRLSKLDCCGFIINKLETYDARYYTGRSTGAYEWATATGGRAILINAPKLVVHFSRPASPISTLDLEPPPAVNITALAEILKANRGGGSPTATLPSAEEVAEFARKFAAKPAWMPEWQWQRVDELRDLSRTRRTDEPFFYNFVPEFVIDRLRTLGKPPRQPSNFDVFGAWIDSIIGRQPRGWSGFEPASEMAQWFVYGSALPQPAREAFRRYWTAWLMPNRKSAPAARQLDRNLLDGSLIHPQADQLSRRV